MKYLEYRNMTSKQIAGKLRKEKLWYDYVTALRGPDFCENNLKDLFTCFLRGKMKLLSGMMGIVYFERKIYSIYKEIISSEKSDYFIEFPGIEFNFGRKHWIRHIYSGLQAVESFGEEVEEIANALEIALCNDNAFSFINIERIVNIIKPL